jgi:hypothetical protein
MKIFSVCIVAIVSTSIFFSCNKGGGSKDCNVGPATGTAPADGAVTYSVSMTGSGKVNSLVYLTAIGPVTQAIPTLPFSVTDSVKKGGSLSITAYGNTSGTIYVSYAFKDGTHDFSDQATCSP